MVKSISDALGYEQLVDHVQAPPISDSGMSPARSETEAQLYAGRNHPDSDLKTSKL